MDTFSKIKNCLEKNKNSVLREFLTDDILGKILKDAKDPLCKLLTDYIYIITLKRRAHNDNTIKVVYRLNHIVKKMIENEKWNSWLQSKLKDYVKTQQPEQKYAILGEIHTIAIFNDIKNISPVATAKNQQTSDFMYKVLNININIEGTENDSKIKI